jgi:outer membrane protein TolC
MGCSPKLRATLVMVTIFVVLRSPLAQTMTSRPVEANLAPVVITLQDAVTRAEANDPGYVASVADRSSAALDRSIGRAALLPSVTYHTQYLYTQPNGSRNQAGQGASSQDAPRFIANNAIREYASQALVTETLSASAIVGLKRSNAAASKAQSDLEIARRALVVAVVSAYYTLVAEESSLRVALRARDEARAFVDLTDKLESGREVAHADGVKAKLELQQRQREFADTQLAAEKARLELGVLILPDPRVPYRLADSDLQTPALPSREDSDAAASKNNPELKSALEALRVSQQEVSSARSAYLPTLSLNYSYGIDAPQYAVNGPGNVRNLGYSAFATLDLPVWDWLATHDRVKQTQLREKVAVTQLTSTQKKLVARLEEYYNEAKVANDALASLEESARTAADSLRLTKLRYSAGEATALEVVDAQAALTLAETTSADGVVRYRIALANLQTLTGIL